METFSFRKCAKRPSALRLDRLPNSDIPGKTPATLNLAKKSLA
jgi:hypothetical protein